MNLWLRLVYVVISGLLKRRELDPREKNGLRLRVLPNDLDAHGHMNNGRYLTLMDLGRYELIARSGLLKELLRKQWAPTVGEVAIHFYRPLKLFQAYELETYVMGWDEKWLTLAQTFRRNGKVHAYAEVRTVFRERRETVSPRRVFAAVGIEVENQHPAAAAGAHH